MPKHSVDRSTSIPSVEQYSPAQQAIAYDCLVPVYQARHELLQPVRHIVLDRVLRGLESGSTVLEVGCGCGASLALIADRQFSVEGVDFAPEMVAAARERARCPIACVDFMSHRFERQYDVVFAQAFIHLFPKRVVGDVVQRLLALARRRVFFSTTINDQPSEGWELKDGVSRYRSRYTLSEIQDLLSRMTSDTNWKMDYFELMDPLGKNWIDVILTREN